MSYAVIRTGGKQYRVSPGMTLTVEKLEGNPGDSVEFDQVLIRSAGDSVDVGAPLVDGATVQGVIVEQGRGDRILIYKKKRRKNYRKRQGHRQYETRVSVTGIS